MEDLVCEICGKIATNKVCDVEEILPEGGYRRYKVHSIHYFCSDHIRNNIEYKIGEK